ncbi:MAG: hypothetical protein SOX83_03605, partial [Sodaliphilus sp.]|nr:hypothetical protein [Sodaliphilus sp.]
PVVSFKETNRTNVPFFSLVLLVKKRQHVNELRFSGDVFRKSDAKLQQFYKPTKLFYIFFTKKAISG